MILTPKEWHTHQHYKDRNPTWIKLHRALLDDYEYSQLPIASRALAPMLWLLASEYDDGKIDATPAKLAFRMRMSERELVIALNPLIDNGFFTKEETVEQSASNLLASCYQGASPERETQEKTETERECSFDDFWKAYPRRKGSPAKEAARRKFEALVKSGTDPAVIIAAAKRSSEEVSGLPDDQRVFIPMASTWLNQHRFTDYESAEVSTISGHYLAALSPELDLWDKWSLATKGRQMPRDAKGGWWVPTQRPPEENASAATAA